MKTKTFNLAQVLSITTGRLCCDIGDVYEILNHITGDNLFTHVLPRAAEFAEPLLLGEDSKLPALTELRACNACLDKLDKWIAADKTPRKTECIKIWLAELRLLFPALPREFEIPSYADRWLSMDPIAELEAAVGEDKVIAVQTP